MNALDLEMASALLDAFAEASRSSAGVRACVLSGRGRAFSAGGNIRAMARALESGAPVESLAQIVDAVHQLIGAIDEAPFPTIAAVSGVVAGAGVGLAAVCDLRFGSPSAELVAGFIRVGMSPDSATPYLLPRLVGMGTATEWLLTNRPVGAEELHRRGFLQAVVGSPEDHARQVASGLAAGPVTATKHTRHLLRSSFDHTLPAHLDLEAQAVAASARDRDLAEGLSAFAEHRTPHFGH